MQTLYLYHLKLKEHVDDDMPMSCDYTQQLIIRAPSAARARGIAQSKEGEYSDLRKYGPENVWIRPDTSSCRRIGWVSPGASTTIGVVISDGISHG